jgi:hypothetical protein
MKTSFWLFLGMIFLLAACGPASSPAGPDPKGPAEVGDGEDMVISLEVSGGIAGISEKYTLFPDGRIISGQGKETRVDPKQFEPVYSELQEQGFFEMQDDYTLFSTCRDCFTYILSVQKGGQIKTVKAEEGSPNAPAGLWVVVREIDALLTEVK